MCTVTFDFDLTATAKHREAEEPVYIGTGAMPPRGANPGHPTRISQTHEGHPGIPALHPGGVIFTLNDKLDTIFITHCPI
jgi:hypothetical protein